MFSCRAVPKEQGFQVQLRWLTTAWTAFSMMLEVGQNKGKRVNDQRGRCCRRERKSLLALFLLLSVLVAVHHKGVVNSVPATPLLYT